MPKYAIEEGVTSPDVSPGGEGPLARQIRALSHGEKGQKPKANVLQIGPNFAEVAHVVLEAYRTKVQPRRHLQGVSAPLGACTPTGTSRAHLWWAIIHRCCKGGYVGAQLGSTHLEVGLRSVWYLPRGDDAFSKEPPPLHL